MCKVFLLLFLQKKKTLAFLSEATSDHEIHNGLLTGARLTTSPHAFSRNSTTDSASTA